MAVVSLVLGLASPVAEARHALHGPWSCDLLRYRPCIRSYCGVFSHRPCIPEFLPPLGQDLRLTIESRDVGEATSPGMPIDSIHELFAALRACWAPPDRDLARFDTQMTVRLSFRRNGSIIGAPRVTYATAGIGEETRQVYRQAITAALDRCTPLPLTAGMAGALAGRPIAIRFVDDRPPHRPAPATAPP